MSRRDVMRHRLLLRYDALADGITTEHLVGPPPRAPWSHPAWRRARTPTVARTVEAIA